MSEAALITSAGLAAAVAAAGNSVELMITHVALGAAAYTPSDAQTALGDRREKALISSGSRNGAQLTITPTFLASAYTGAQYEVGEIGFYAGDPDSGGTLFAIVSAPGRASPRRGGANSTNYTPTFIMNLAGTPAGSVNVTFSPDSAAALIALAAHVSASDPHTQYVQAAGDTMTGPLVLAGDASAALHPVALRQFNLPANQSKTTNGFQKLPGGLIFQWGTYASDLIVSSVGATAPTDVPFPIPFPNACLNVQLTGRNPGNSPISDSWPELVSFDADSFVMVPQNTGNPGNSFTLHGFTWFAIGH